MIYKTRAAQAYYGPVLPDGKWCSLRYSDNLGTSTNALINWQKGLLDHPSWYTDRYFWQPGLAFSQKFGSTNRGFGRYNDCENYKTQIWSVPFSARYWSPSAEVVGLRRIILPGDMASRLQTVAAKKPLPHMDSLIQIARMRATCNLVPAVEPYVEMLNFLFELKDFRDIVKDTTKLFGNHQKQITDTLTVMRSRLSARKNGLPTVEPTGAIAGGWLFNQFVVQPFLRDMSDIIAGLSQVATDTYTKFQKQGLEPGTMHYSEVVHEQVLESAAWGLFPDSKIATFDTVEKVKFTATLNLRYQAPDLSNAEIQKAAWGLKFTPAVLWNATKFTFLLDYFVRIGKALEQAHRYKNRVNVIPIQYCESVLSENATGFYVWGGNVREIDIGCIGKLTSNPNKKALTVVRRSEYKRFLAQQAYCMPLPKMKVPSGTQGLNMLALARVFL